MKRSISILLVLVLLAGLTGCVIKDSKQEETTKEPTEETMPQDPSSPVLYKVTDDQGHVVYMLGSIHVGTEQMYPLPQYVLDAYEQSDALAVELDIIAATKDLSGAMDAARAMVLSDGTKISDHISQECYDKCVEIMKENKSYYKALDMYKPIMWYSLISTFAMEESGAKSELGIDYYFLEKAHEEEKTIYEVESAAYQYDLLGNLSMELQVLMLEQTAEAYGTEYYNGLIRSMCACWASGDEAGVLMSEESETSTMSPEELELYLEFDTTLEGERNLNMTRYAQDALTSGKTVFIVVGAAHVYGDDGMAKQLAERGYTVERITG